MLFLRALVYLLFWGFLIDPHIYLYISEPRREEFQRHMPPSFYGNEPIILDSKSSQLVIAIIAIIAIAAITIILFPSFDSITKAIAIILSPVGTNLLVSLIRHQVAITTILLSYLRFHHQHDDELRTAMSGRSQRPWEYEWDTNFALKGTDTTMALQSDIAVGPQWHLVYE
jgi:hypothetical protein